MLFFHALFNKMPANSNIYFKFALKLMHMKRRTLLFSFVDIFIVFLAFLFAAYFKTGKEKALFNYYWVPFLIFETVWIISSLIFKKYKVINLKNKADNIFNIIKSNLFVLFTITFVIRYTQYKGLGIMFDIW